MAVELLEVGLEHIGVMQCGKLQTLSMSDPDYPTDSPATIIPNERGEYIITQAMISGTSSGEFYDGSQKVLEWTRDDKGQLIIEAFTSHQINCFANINEKECLIKAKGPLLLEGTLHIESMLSIDTEALLFADAIVCDGTVAFTVEQGVGFLAPVSSKDFIVNAAFIHQSADFQVAGQMDVSAQVFKQEPHVTTSAESLCLLASQCC